MLYMTDDTLQTIALEQNADGKEVLTLKSVFDSIMSDVRFDTKFANKVNRYQVGFINRNQDHLEFFGGNLLGVQVIRFKDSDVTKFFDEVLEVDYDYVKQKVRQVQTIDHDYKVAGDVLNLTLFYLIHRCLTSDNLTNDKKMRAALDVALIFFYRSICAVHSYYFKYPFDPRIAQEAYRRLSGKFLIKQLGSWNEVMLYRAHSLLDRNSVHLNVINKFDDDDKIVYMIADSQGRIKDLVKNYAIELYKTHEEGANIATTSSTGKNMEGEESIKDRTEGAQGYVIWMKSVLSDRSDFIKNDLISVISSISSNTSTRVIKNTLNWLVDNYQVTKYSKDIDTFVGNVVIQSLYMIENSIPLHKRRDTAYVLKTIKDLYLSTRTTDKDILDIRKIGDKLVRAANGRVSKSLILATRTSIILYITIRMMAKNK